MKKFYLKKISFSFYDVHSKIPPHQGYPFISHLTYMKTKYEQIKNYVFGYPLLSTLIA